MVFGHGRVTGRSSAMSRLISAAAVGEAFECEVAAAQVSPVIHANDVAEIMVRICFAQDLQLPVYSGLNKPASVRDAVDAVRRYLPDADIRFADDALSYPTIKHVDCSRLEQAIDYKLPLYEKSVLDYINEARAERQLTAL
jgi:nucleoside-diphosphate-sugar epimerase